jgi:hypothetical protein
MRMPLAEHQSNKVTMAINKRQREIGVDARLRKFTTGPSSLLLFPSLPLPQFWPIPSFPISAPTPAPPLVPVTSPGKKRKKKKKEGECNLCSILHMPFNSRTCSAKTPPSKTMINVFPAESTRSASIWSSRVSTPSTGVTTVRIEGIVTVMYIAVAKTNAAISFKFCGVRSVPPKR